jgi:hypothetical protein
MPEFQDMLKSEQAAKLMKDSKKLERLRDAPETQRLFQLLSQSAGGNLEQAAGRAAQGDTASLMDAIGRLMRDPEGQKLLQQMKRSIK